MKYGRKVKRLTTKQLAKARAKQKTLEAEYTTASGETVTVRELQSMMKRANRRLKAAKEYTTEKEYEALVRKYETSIAATAAFESGTTRYSTKAMKKMTPGKLRAADTAVRTALASSYMSKRTYNKIPEKRYQKYLERGYVKNREQFDMLIGLFSSEAWQVLHDSGLMGSDQLIQIMKDMVFSQGTASQRVADDISNLLDTYADALKFKDWAQKPLGRYTPGGEVTVTTNEASEWDNLITDTTKIQMEANPLAGIKYEDEFYKKMRDDLIDIIRRG